jgi:hypothetical protein
MAGWRVTASSMSSKRPAMWGADRLAHHVADEVGDLLAGDGEVVGPEADQAFAEAVRGFHGDPEDGGGLGEQDAALVGPAHAGAGAGAVLGLGGEDGGQGGGQVGRQGRGGQAGGELRRQPGGRVGRCRVVGAAAKAEADGGDDGQGIHAMPC